MNEIRMLSTKALRSTLAWAEKTRARGEDFYDLESLRAELERREHAAAPPPATAPKRAQTILAAPTKAAPVAPPREQRPGRTRMDRIDGLALEQATVRDAEKRAAEYAARTNGRKA